MAGAGAIRAGRAYVEINADDSGFLAGLKRAEDQLKAFGERTSEMGRQMMTASSVVLAPSAMATRVFAGFDDAMREVQAKSQGSVEQLEMLTEKAKQLGATTSWTAQQIAEGMVQMSQLGFKPEEIDKSIGAVMDLARATHTDVASAAEIAGNALRAFHLPAEDMTKVCDQLTVTANSSATNLLELGDALKYIASNANMSGQNLSSTLEVLGGLADSGLKGSLGGTAMRTMLSRLADFDMRDYIKNSLYTDVTADDGSIRPLNEIMRDLDKATGTWDNVDRMDLFSQLFEQRGMTGAGILAGADTEDLAAKLENAEGVARRTAETMDKGVGGSMRMFASAVEAVAIKIGESLAPEIQKLSELLIENAQKVGDWVTQNKETIVTVAETALKIGAAGAALFALGETVGAVSAAVGGFSTVIGAIGTAAGVIASAPVAATIAAIGVAAAGAAVALHDFGDSAEEIAKQHEERAATDNANLERLQALADKTQLTNREMLEAARIAADLNSRYHDLGIEVDSTTGKITGLAGAQEKLNAAQLRTKIYDQQQVLKEKQKEYEDKYGKITLGGAKEYTQEELQELDKQGRQGHVTTENHVSSLVLEQQGSNIERAAYNEQTGKFQVASQKSGLFKTENAEDARQRLQYELDQAALAAKEIEDLKADIDSLKALQAPIPGTVAPSITPAAAPNVAAANEAAQTQNALQAESNELQKETVKVLKEVRDGVNKESDTI